MSENISDDEASADGSTDPIHDPDRLATLRQSEGFGTGAGEAFDHYPPMVTRHLDVPIAVVAAIHEDHQCYESAVGLPPSLEETGEIPLSNSVSKYVVRKDEPLAIGDLSASPLTEGDPSVEKFGMVAYLGVPVRTPEGHVIGSVCAFDRESREWTAGDVAFMETVATAVGTEVKPRHFADEQFARLDPESLLGPLVKSSLDGIMVLEPVYAGKDGEGRLEDFVCRLINTQGAHMMGHPRDELMGARLYEYFDRPRGSGLFNVFQRVTETGESYSDTLHYDREDLRGWFDVTITSWTGGVLAHFHDVTDHKEIQEALRESEERFRLLAENTSDVLLRVSPGGEVKYISPASRRVFGMEPEEMKERVGEDLVHPEDRAVAKRMFEEVLENGSSAPTTFRHRRDDGNYQWIEARARGVEDPVTGKITEVVSALRDVTERIEREHKLEEAQEEAEAANKAKSQFLANMSHELRTPLNAVIGYSEMVQEDLAGANAGDEEQQREQMLSDLGQIHSAGEQLLALVNDVLDISKIEAGEMKLHPETFDVAAMATGTAETIRPMIEEGGNQLIVDCAEDVGTIYTDKTKLRQALFNLLSNASKFTSDGEITLRVHREEMPGGDPGFAFAVEDTGIGMTEEEQAEVFGTFAQADTSLTREHEGTGLGLVISQNLCEMMGGRLDLDSEKGVGSTFTVRLPAEMKRQHGTREPEESSDEPEEPGKSKEPSELEEADESEKEGATKPSAPEAPEVPESEVPESEVPEGEDLVLVIDDDERARQIIGRRLEKEGFVVRTASGGEEGLEAARTLNPTVITLDVMMPEMDGWAVLGALKDDEDLKDIPVVMVTIVEDENMGYTLGASDYLTKPLDPDRLARVLDQYRTGEDCSVMIVEDEAATRDLIRRTLEEEGCTARAAENGHAGLKMLEEPGPVPNMIILDLMMPEIDGFAFMEAMREREDLPRVPVVVVTAKDLTTEDRKRLNGGVDAILKKGDYGRGELLDEVHRAVATAST